MPSNKIFVPKQSTRNLRYDVFVRDWWRFDNYGNRVPYPGAPREYLARDVTYKVARDMCSDWNSTHEPGDVSRKAEFEIC